MIHISTLTRTVIAGGISLMMLTGCPNNGSSDGDSILGQYKGTETITYATRTFRGDITMNFRGDGTMNVVDKDGRVFEGQWSGDDNSFSASGTASEDSCITFAYTGTAGRGLAKGNVEAINFCDASLNGEGTFSASKDGGRRARQQGEKLLLN